MILMIALGVGIIVGFNIEWVSIEKNTDEFYSQTGYADFRVVNERGFSSDDAKKLAERDGVDAVSRYVAFNAEVDGTSGKQLSLTVTENFDVSSFVVTSGEEYDAESTDKMWLSDRYAQANGVKLNDEISVSYEGRSIKCKVAGLIKSSEYLICVRDETQLMPKYEEYSFAYVSPKAYKAALGGFEYYPQLNVRSNLSKQEFVDLANSAFGKSYLVLSKDDTVSYSQAQGEATEGKTMGSVLPVLFLLIAVLTMVTTMHRITIKEKTQIGTLKALGFKDRRIVVHYASYALAAGIIGSIPGIALGFGLAAVIMNPNGTMGTYFDMPQWKLYMPWFCWLILFGILALLTLVGFLSVKNVLKGSVADALKPYVPKKARALLIERTKLWQKASFGTKWNVRDVFRNKARTLMSLFGTLGCVIIIVAAFGMRDTMSNFISSYYDGAMNYSSRIYLADGVTDAQADELIQKYEGDWSGSIAVEIGDEAVSMDVYGITHERIRFLNEDGKYVELGDNGAYICSRIADEYGLKVGSTFTVRKFGTSTEYHMVVAGIVRSVTKSIIVTPAYASSVNADYVKDSVYTLTVKDNVERIDAIKSVQSKQELIDTFNTFTEIMDMMIWACVVAAVILGVVVLYNLGVMGYAERYREMATLKVIGFKDSKIGGLLVWQNLWISFVGILAGIPLGFGVLDFLVQKLATEYELLVVINVWSYLLALVITVGTSLVVSLAVARKNKHIDMVEALKFAE